MAARRTLVALASSIAIVAAGALTSPAAAHDRGRSPEKFAQKVTTRAVQGHLAALQRIADKNGGNRAALTSGYEESARYVERTLRKAGYTTERDPFTFDREIIDTATLTENSPGSAAYEVDQMEFSPNSPVGGVTGDLVAPTDPLGCLATDWSTVAATGKIALISRGACAFAIKAANAEAAGAVGVAIYNNVPDVQLFGTLGAEGVTIPVAGFRQADGQALATALAAGTVNVTLDLTSHTETAESFNVIAETKQGRDDNVVMLGAHLDGVEEGPGINDNGTGSAAILEVAVQLAKSHTPHHNTVRFAWWGAEELGLIGSTAYVEELATQEGELDRIATYLNYDMVGSPNYIIGVYDADESTYPAPVDVPEGSVATEAVLTSWFDSIGQPWVDTEFSGRSDYQAFILNGVPASGLFTGADDVKTDEEVALFGGTAGITHDPNYHSVGDDLSNVNATALGIMTKAIAASTYSLAWDTSAINGVSGPGKGKPHPGHGHGPGKHLAPEDRVMLERAS
ncbi:M20/M25/M40 family metallo-hydrolase [Cellulomonas humilata]|uniref:Zn-dependent M28 family amino/carboxypeptidase n=1 Tax=Cellulomonas humilata TaxID=144055 RepID=A0ABU0ECB8_9CELL|nr:M20/M25/M40 family metallo-hydrolase [Cellulomonas humilata]MDQ0372726.1 Zn-dependent M28 family amino/carboxypeptidase [Cellulomonas humilata]